MTHSVTSKLNNDAREHANSAGVTFFVSLGEKNYNHKTKTSEYTNYDAALFAKDNQIDFYRKCLVKDSIIQVSGTGIIMEIDLSGQYQPKLVIQDAKLGFVNDQLCVSTGQAAAPQQYAQPQAAPQAQQYAQPQQQPAPVYNNQQAPQAQQPQAAPQGNFQKPQ